MLERQMFYEACPDCKKKVAPNDHSNGFYCERCSKVHEKCKVTYNFTTRLADFSGCIYVQTMGENVGDSMIGMSAENFRQTFDLKDMGMQQSQISVQNPEFRDYMDSKIFERGIYLIRAKVDQYTMGSENQENRVRFMLVKHLKTNDFKSENAMLLERLGRYRQM